MAPIEATSASLAVSAYPGPLLTPLAVSFLRSNAGLRHLLGDMEMSFLFLARKEEGFLMGPSGTIPVLSAISPGTFSSSTREAMSFPG